MSRRAHLPLSLLLLLALASAVVAGLFIQVRRPDIGRKAVEEQVEGRSPRGICDRLGHEWTYVTRSSPNVSLCYKVAWGWPNWMSTDVDPQSYRGKAYDVVFVQDGSPHLSFESPDFALTGPTDAPRIPWSAVDITKPESELRALFGAQDVRVFTIGTASVVKVTESGIDIAGDAYTSIQYLVRRPELFMRITAHPDQTDDIETMLRASL